MLDKKKVCFISCVNDENKYKKSLDYINNLKIPLGYQVEFICKKNAQYLTKAYNDAMDNTNAKYKVYIHQDVYIINKNFIEDILGIFERDTNIGMIGMAGAKDIPRSGIWWESHQRYGKVYSRSREDGVMKLLQFKAVENHYEKVEAIDGLIMITQYDIPWRDDFFDGWHFYDISQCFEFTKAGYDIVIPKQEKIWCMHDCSNERNSYYDRYRKIFIDLYFKKQ
jgi:hypothetical protein